jgi:hypothetical protein
MFRTQNLAETTAQLCFGISTQCAKRHNHPFECWTQDDYYSMTAFFSRVRQKKGPEGVGRRCSVALEMRTDERPRTEWHFQPKSLSVQYLYIMLLWRPFPCRSFDPSTRSHDPDHFRLRRSAAWRAPSAYSLFFRPASSRTATGAP